MNARDALGRIVREAWIRWATTQPNPKPSWLTPYDDLNEADKEADRQIAEAVIDACCAAHYDRVTMLEDHNRRADLAGRTLARRLERTMAALSKFVAASCVTEIESARTAAREALGPGYLNCGCPAAAGICRRTALCIFLRRCETHCYGHPNKEEQPECP